MKNYFKKLSIMLVMLLALIGVGLIQNGTIANAATVGQVLTQPEDGWKRYDDNDSRIKFNGTWLIENGLGHFNSTSKASTVNNSTITFKFYGNKLRIISPNHPDFPTDAVITIDGISSDFLEYSNSLRYQIMVFEKNEIPLGIHDVKISFTNKKISFDAIDINSTGYLIDTNKSITLDKSSMNLTEGNSEQLTATTTPSSVGVTWTSSDASVATVDSTGKATGVREGKATITATTADGLSAICTVTVTNTSGISGGNTTPTNPTDTNGGTSTVTDETSTIVNIAHAKGDNTNNAGGEVSIIFHGTADTTLSVVKTADVKDVWVGDNFTYTIVVTNTGSKTAKAVVVNDTAPNHIQFIPSGITTTQGAVDSTSTPSNIVVNVGDIPPSGTVTIKVPATVIL